MENTPLVKRPLGFNGILFTWVHVSSGSGMPRAWQMNSTGSPSRISLYSGVTCTDGRSIADPGNLNYCFKISKIMLGSGLTVCENYVNG